MIQITLRRTNSGTPDRNQRPDDNQRGSDVRPERPPRTFIPYVPSDIQTGDVWRDELPRPNAPAHDEIYNNRSISPLFVGLGNRRQNSLLCMIRPPLAQSSPQDTSTHSTESPRLMSPIEFISQPGTSSEYTPELPQDLSLLVDRNIGERSFSVNNCDSGRVLKRARLNPYLKRKDETRNSKGSNLLRAVLAALECPVCLDYASPPIRLCQQGHMLCAGCRSRINACPECRGPFLNTRARGLENIAAIVDYPCSNQGCSIEVPLSHRLHHSVTCSLRRFSCLFTHERECVWQGLKSDLIPHGLSAHPESITMESTTKFHLELTSDTSKYIMMNCFLELFHIVFIVDTTSRFVFGTVRKLCSSVQTEGFLVTICCESPLKQRKVKMTFSHAPLAESTLTHNRNTLVSSAIFRCTFETLCELMYENRLLIAVTITRSKEENESELRESQVLESILEEST